MALLSQYIKDLKTQYNQEDLPEYDIRRKRALGLVEQEAQKARIVTGKQIGRAHV